MKKTRSLLLCVLCAAPLLAFAQWQWVDNAGRRVFSDQPPPSDIAPNRILKQPGQRGPALAPPEAAAPATTAAALPKPSGTDPVLERKRKEAEAAEAAKKKAEEEKVAAMRADNCTRAKSSKATFDSGVRVARTNARGEREIMDDAQRAAEVKHLEEIIRRDCTATQ
jgi:hypothetical protein